MSKVETIACQCGNIFAASIIEHISTSWKINREFYKLQGCIIGEADASNFKFGSTKECCEQRKNLLHIDDLLDEFRDEILDELEADEYDDEYDY